MDLDELLAKLPDNVKRKISGLCPAVAAEPTHQQAPAAGAPCAGRDAPPTHLPPCAPAAAQQAGGCSRADLQFSFDLPQLREGRGAAVLDAVLPPAAVQVGPRTCSGPGGLHPLQQSGPLQRA